MEFLMKIKLTIGILAILFSSNLVGAQTHTVSIKYDSVCIGVSDTLFLTKLKKDSAYQWQVKKSSGSSFTNLSVGSSFYSGIKSVKLVILNTPYSFKGNEYRVQIVDSGGSVGYSDSVDINVYDSLILSSLSTSKDTLCDGTGTTLKLSSIRGGGGGAYSYVWKSSTTQTGRYDSIANSSDSLTLTNQHDSKYYKLFITSGKNCGPDSTSPQYIHVYDSLSIGNITGPTSPICYGTGTTIKVNDAKGGDGNYQYSWKNNSSGSWSTYGSPSKFDTLKINSLKVTTSYQVKLMNTCGDTVTKVFTVNVYDSLSIGNITGPTPPICYGTGTTIKVNDAKGGDGNYQYSWKNNSSGSWSTYGSPSKFDTLKINSLKVTTSYQVKLMNTCGDTVTKEFTVNVYDSLNLSSLSTSKDTLCDGTGATLKLSSIIGGGGGPYKYVWKSNTTQTGRYDSIANSSDSLTLTNQHDSKYYKLFITSGKNCGPDSTSPQYIHVYDPLSVGNITVDSTICVNDTVYFTFKGPSVASYYWSFDDLFSGQLNTDTNQNPNHVFTQIGSYGVRLIVKDTGNCADTVFKKLKVVGMSIASFEYNNSCVGLSTIFNSTSKLDTLDEIKSYNWWFGDNGVDSIQNPIHFYKDTGSYSVGLKIVSNFGCIDTIEQFVMVFDSLTVTKDVNSICQGNLVKLNVSTNTSSGSSWNWDFGDSSASALTSPNHQYNKTGLFKYSVKVSFANGKSCNSDSGVVLVNPLPDPRFTLLTDSVQCFTRNKTCLKLNKPLQGLTFRSIAFDDGFVDKTSPLQDSIICYKYKDPSGGKYSITISVLDSNSCSATYSGTDTILIHPELIASFDDTLANGCFQTVFDLKNESNFSPSYVTNFKWDFGDGIIDTTNWTGFKHGFNVDGVFKIQLTIRDKFGCKDTFQSKNQITNVSFITDAFLDSIGVSCFSNNLFSFNQTSISKATIKWYFGDGASSMIWNPKYRYQNPGIYRPWVTITKSGCDSTIYLDSALVSGPKAIIGNVTNRYQCQIKDTIEMRNNSIAFMNGPLSVFWNANDLFGPNCTLNTKTSQNIGLNCMFSEDSLLFRHMYSPGKENCYFPRLIVSDSTSGCTDTGFVSLLLAPPVASTATPFFTSKVCPGPEDYKRVTINLNNTSPTCGRQATWVMWDSLCAAESNNFDSFWNFNVLEHNYNYDDLPCDSNGNITIGLIIENGRDSLGSVCRDTAFYHNILNISPFDPRFTSTYDPATYYCKNATFSFTLNDTIQDSIAGMTWNWGDGSFSNDINFSSRSHTYNKAGSYLVVLTLQHKNGCSGIDSIRVKVGLTGSFTISNSEICLGNPIVLNEQVRYFSDNNAYWSDSMRRALGKETLSWDFADGNGFVSTLPNPTVFYNKIGIYNIKLAVKDSFGCRDTFVLNKAVKVFNVTAGFSTIQDTFVCDQLVDFTSYSTTYDSLNSFGHLDDRITSFLWTFTPGNSISSHENPSKFLQAGTHKINLVVNNTKGCVDSASLNVTITGPSANFEIISDSIGCEPLVVTFKNNSKKANDYAWYFGDAGNNVLNTSSDSNTTFSYPSHGTYYPYIVSQGQFLKDGISITCQSTFPNPRVLGFREIIVNETPKPRFTYNTDCKTNTTIFTNESSISTGSIVKYEWYFGDGDTSSQFNPTHQYPDTGRYTVILKAYSDLGCVDSLVKKIVISPFPLAWFWFTKTCLGDETNFYDSTFAFNDIIYLWNWDLGDGTGSSLKNPVTKYTKDTIYQVTLTTTNIAGCKSTVSRDIEVYSLPKPSMNYSNACLRKPIKLNNLTKVIDAPMKVLWKLGDGTTSMVNNLDKFYDSSGTYKVTMISTNRYGCSDSVTQGVDVYMLPKTDFIIEDTLQCSAENVFKFINASTVDTGSMENVWLTGNTMLKSFYTDTVNHSFKEWGRLRIRLISTTSNLCRDTAIRYIVVEPSPIADVIIKDTVQCLVGNQFVLTDSSSSFSGNYTRKWDLENGSFPTDSIIKISFPDSGLYRVRLMVESSNKCKDTVASYLRINSHPKAAFNINDSAQCLLGNIFSLSDSSKTIFKSTNANWYFGDGDTSIIKNPLHSYLRSDTFIITLVSTNFKGCKDTAVREIITHPMPNADFTIDNAKQCEIHNLFGFTNTSTISSGSLIYNWYFGDNDSSTLLHSSHSYDTFGAYKVSLISTSLEGCFDTVDKTVVVNATPLANFSINKIEQCFSGNSFIFRDMSSKPSGGFSRKWDFGDNTVSYASYVVKAYTSPGTYNVKLFVLSGNGCTDSIIKTVIVHPNSIPDFAITDSVQCKVGNSFLFTNKTKLSSGSYTTDWKFGDGGVSFAKHALHSYDTFGTFSVTLVTKTDHNCLDSITQQVRVNPMPIINAGVNDSTQCVNDQKFEFYDSSFIGEGSFGRLWTFGDNNTSILDRVSKSYDTFGGYKIILTLTSDKGCIDSFVKNVEVYPKTYSNFDILDSILCLRGNSFNFANTTSLVSGNFKSYWYFGDMDTAKSFNATHSYKTFGDYDITLITETNFNCFDTITKQVRVNPMPIINAGVNDSTQCVNDQKFEFYDSSFIGEGSFGRLWTFGDNNTSILDRVSKSYDTFGGYKIILTLTSDKGCIDSFVKNVEVYPKTYSNFDILDSILCLRGNSFNFANTTSLVSGNFKSYWYFGDMDTAKSFNATHSYKTFGDYDIILITETNFNCFDTITKPIRVMPMPETSISANDSGQCENDNLVQLSSIRSIAYTGIKRYLWDLGDGYYKGPKDTFLLYYNYGIKTVSFVAESEFGCKDTSFLDIEIYPIATADFSINDSAQCLNGNQFNFTNTTNIPYGSVKYEWDFGNGTTDTVTSPSKMYVVHDTLTVTLISTSVRGCLDTFTKDVIIYPQPNPDFSINDSGQCLTGNQFVFTNHSTIDYGNISFKWGFGDLNYVSSLDASHSYLMEDSFNVVLSVSSQEGCMDSISRLVIVYPKPNPVISLDDYGQCLKNQSFNFKNLSNISSGSIDYLWRFGDGDSANLEEPTHFFNNVGAYTIKLLTTSEYNCKDSTSISIRLFADPIAAFTINDSLQCINDQSFLLNSTSSVVQGSIEQHRWSFSDGKNYIGPTTAHKFLNSGLFRAVITVITDSGCVDSIEKSIRVFPKPISRFNYNDSAQCLFTNQYLFTENAFDSFGIRSYEWDLDGKAQSNNQTADHIFVSIGSKLITLIVESVNDCWDTSFREVFVKPVPDPRFEDLKPFYCQSDSIISLNPKTLGGIFYGKNVSGFSYQPKELWRDSVKYIVTENGCTDSSKQFTNVLPIPSISLGNDTLLCKYEELHLNITYNSYKYLWDDGSINPFRVVNKAGTYWAKASNSCGEDIDSIIVTYRPYNCHFHMPNAFTPNGDGKNDIFTPVLLNVEHMNLQIYNRWGEKIYDQDMNSPGWRGDFGGKRVQAGTYLWVVDYSFKENGRLIKLYGKGDITLLR